MGCACVGGEESIRFCSSVVVRWGGEWGRGGRRGGSAAAMVASGATVESDATLSGVVRGKAVHRVPVDASGNVGAVVAVVVADAVAPALSGVGVVQAANAREQSVDVRIAFAVDEPARVCCVAASTGAPLWASLLAGVPVLTGDVLPGVARGASMNCEANDISGNVGAVVQVAQVDHVPPLSSSVVAVEVLGVAYTAVVSVSFRVDEPCSVFCVTRANTATSAADVLAGQRVVAGANSTGVTFNSTLLLVAVDAACNVGTVASAAVADVAAPQLQSLVVTRRRRARRRRWTCAWTRSPSGRTCRSCCAPWRMKYDGPASAPEPAPISTPQAATSSAV